MNILCTPFDYWLDWYNQFETRCQHKNRGINWILYFYGDWNDVCILLVCILCEIKYYRSFDTRYLVSESDATMGQDGSGPEFHVNFGSGRVTLVVGRVGSDQAFETRTKGGKNNKLQCWRLMSGNSWHSTNRQRSSNSSLPGSTLTVWRRAAKVIWKKTIIFMAP